MLKYIRRLSGVLEKPPAVAVGTNGTEGYKVLVTDRRLLMMEEVTPDAPIEAEQPLTYTRCPQDESTPIDLDAKSGKIAYPKDAVLVEPEDLKGYPPCNALVNVMNSLIPKMSVFTLPYNLGNLKEKFILMEIKQGNLLLRCGDEMEVLTSIDPVNFGKVEVKGDYIFVMPAELLRVMKDYHTGPYPFGVYKDEDKNTIYFLTYTKEFRALYSCIPLNENDLKKKKEPAVTEETTEPSVEELAAAAPVEESVPPETEEEPTDGQEMEAPEETVEESAPEETGAESVETGSVPPEAETEGSPGAKGDDNDDTGTDTGEPEQGDSDGDGDSTMAGNETDDNDGGDEEAAAKTIDDVDPLEAYDIIIPNKMKEIQEVTREAGNEIKKILKNATKQCRKALQKQGSDSEAEKWKAKYEDEHKLRKEKEAQLDDIQKRIAPVKDLLFPKGQ